MKINTDYIKNILISKYGNNGWKRISKNKTIEGVLRVFSNSQGELYSVLSNSDDTEIIDIALENPDVKFIKKMAKEIVPAEQQHKGVSLDISDKSIPQQEQIQKIVNALVGNNSYDKCHCERFSDNSGPIYNFYEKLPSGDPCDPWGYRSVSVALENGKINSIFSTPGNISYIYKPTTKKVKAKNNGFGFYIPEEKQDMMFAEEWVIYISKGGTNKGTSLNDESFPDSIYETLEKLNMSEAMECVFTYDGPDSESITRDELIKLMKDAGFTED
jgi:hypothetical protein